MMPSLTESERWVDFVVPWRLKPFEMNDPLPFRFFFLGANFKNMMGVGVGVGGAALTLLRWIFTCWYAAKRDKMVKSFMYGLSMFKSEIGIKQMCSQFVAKFVASQKWSFIWSQPKQFIWPVQQSLRTGTVAVIWTFRRSASRFPHCYRCLGKSEKFNYCSGIHLGMSWDVSPKI